MHDVVSDGSSCVLSRQWDAPIVILSFVASAAGAYAGLTALVQVLTARRAAARALATARAYPLQFLAEMAVSARLRRWSHVFMLSAAISLGMCAVWVAHFVGMDAMLLYDCEGNAVPVGFEPRWTLGSLVVACVGGFLVISMLVSGAMQSVSPASVRPTRTSAAVDPRRPHGDQLTPPIHNGSGVTAAASDKLSQALQASVPSTAKTSARARVAWLAMQAGTIVFTAATMHYGGMQGLSGQFRMEHDPLIVALSTALLIVGASVVSVVSLHPSAGKQLDRFDVRVGVSMVGALIVMAFHYSSVLGTQFIRDAHADADAAGGQGDASARAGAWQLGPSLLLTISLATIVTQLALCHHASEMIARRSAIEEERRLMRVSQLDACKQLLSIELTFKYPMVLISLSKLRKLGELRTHEHLRESGLLTFLDTPAVAFHFALTRHICFISHQCVAGRCARPGEPRAATPAATRACSPHRRPRLGTRAAPLSLPYLARSQVGGLGAPGPAGRAVPHAHRRPRRAPRVAQARRAPARQ